jgi:hypothetical protein
VLWFSVWTVLVVATIVGAVVLALSLWRKGKALLRQLEETGRVLDVLQTRVDELDAARQPEPSFRPALLAPPARPQHRAPRRTPPTAARGRVPPLARDRRLTRANSRVGVGACSPNLT